MSKMSSLMASALLVMLTGNISANQIGTITVNGETSALSSFSVNATSSGAISVTATTVNSGNNGGGEPQSYTVTATAGIGGRIDPVATTVTEGTSVTLKLYPDDGYKVSSVTGCGGSLSGDSFIINPVTSTCSVQATFASENAGGNGSCGSLPSGVDLESTYPWDIGTGTRRFDLTSRTISFEFTTTSNVSSWGQVITAYTTLNPTSRTMWISECPGGEPLDRTAAIPRCMNTDFETSRINWAQYPRNRTCVLQPNTRYYLNIRNSLTWNGPTLCTSGNCPFYLQNQVY